MNTTEDMKFLVILNCVKSDLQSIDQGNYDDIIQKMKSLPTRNLESVLEVLNLHVVHNMAGANEKKPKKPRTKNNDLKII